MLETTKLLCKMRRLFVRSLDTSFGIDAQCENQEEQSHYDNTFTVNKTDKLDTTELETFGPFSFF